MRSDRTHRRDGGTHPPPRKNTLREAVYGQAGTVCVDAYAGGAAIFQWAKEHFVGKRQGNFSLNETRHGTRAKLGGVAMFGEPPPGILAKIERDVTLGDLAGEFVDHERRELDTAVWREGVKEHDVIQ